MPHVVTQACFGCKNTECLDNCPTDAFREGEQMLYIDPEACIDCYLCGPLCPVEAIYPDDEVPTEMVGFIALNAEMAPLCPEITEKKVPLS